MGTQGSRCSQLLRTPMPPVTPLPLPRDSSLAPQKGWLCPRWLALTTGQQSGPFAVLLVQEAKAHSHVPSLWRAWPWVTCSTYIFRKLAESHSKSPRKKALFFPILRWGKLAPLDWKVIKGFSKEMDSLAGSGRTAFQGWPPNCSLALQVSSFLFTVNFKSIFISTNKSKTYPSRNKSSLSPCKR